MGECYLIFELSEIFYKVKFNNEKDAQMGKLIVQTYLRKHCKVVKSDFELISDYISLETKWISEISDMIKIKYIMEMEN